MEYKLSEKNGVVMAVVPDDVSKENVEELLELLAKSYHMRDNSRETEEREIPDYMWIMAEESKRPYTYRTGACKTDRREKNNSRTEIAEDAG